MSEIITAPIALIFAAFLAAVGIVWLIFPFMVCARLDKIRTELADLNTRSAREESRARQQAKN